MAELGPARRTPSRLVGQPLIYAITAFASLGVFLVASYPCLFHILPDLLSSSDMIKGLYSSWLTARAFELISNVSVMSGIITGPHFRKYFNDPGPGELGIMVAILEIGAFSTLNSSTCRNRSF